MYAYLKFACSSLFAVSLASIAHGSTVKLNWTDGKLILPTQNIQDYSTVYSSWSPMNIGLWIEGGYEVMMNGEFGYSGYPFFDNQGAGMIASQEPGLGNYSLTQTISRSDGTRFSLKELDVLVDVNQYQAEYYYSSPSEGVFELDYLEASGFRVALESQTGVVDLDPNSYEFNRGVQNRKTKTFSGTDFAGAAQSTSYLTVGSSNFVFTSPCDPRYISAVSAVIRDNIDCSDPATFGKQTFTQSLGGNRELRATVYAALLSQNFRHSFLYSQTLVAVPLPNSFPFILMGLGMLLVVKRKRLHD